MIISDEFGVPVVVQTNSPCRKAVNELKRKHFDWVVLPRRALLGLTEPTKDAIMKVHTEQGPPRAIPTSAIDHPESWDLLRMRLLECIEVLNAGK